MPEYRVIWSIVLGAHDKVEAAVEALEVMRDYGSTATVFIVQRVDAPAGEPGTTVDLLTGVVSRPRTVDMDTPGTVHMDTVEGDDDGTG